MSVIRFSVPSAMECLRRNGIVYTLRAKRKHLGKISVLFRDEKVGIAEIREIGKVDLKSKKVNDEHLNKFLKLSGFSSVEEWIRTALLLNTRYAREDMRLYEVRIIEWTSGKTPTVRKRHWLGKNQRKIYELLVKERGRKLSVDDIVRITEMNRKAVTAALRYLRRRGMINVEQTGKSFIVWVD